MSTTESGKVDKDWSLIHRMDRRLASIDKYYLTHVSNKAFSDYFENGSYGCLTEFIRPDERDRLTEFIDTFDGTYKSEVFWFKNYKGEYRLNILRLLSEAAGSKDRSINIEMIDIDNLVKVNDNLRSDVMKHRIMLGLTGSFTFTYSREDNVFSMYRYEQVGREILYKMDIDEWKQEMSDKNYIPKGDMAMFNNLVSQIKTYVQSFSVKLSTSMRTQGQVMEEVRFVGTLYSDHDGEKCVIGRVLSEETLNRHSQMVEMIEELTYDALTKVYNKKTITEYAIKLLKQEKRNKVTIVILDVDHFKKVNDIYGHMYGDKVLARVGKKLKEIVGDDGTIGRIGGDEFMIVFNGINDDRLLRGMLRAIRTQIKWEFTGDFEDFMITCSIGAAFSPNNGTEYEELFKKADYCLYIAKEKGRDRYVFFRDELHKKSYEQSVSESIEKKAENAGREMKELRYISRMMSEYNIDRRMAVSNMFKHMMEFYNVDCINVFYGEDLKRVYTAGTVSNNSEDAMYVYTEGFKRLLGDSLHAEIGFVGHKFDVAPEFCEAMKERRIFATIQCIIGSADDISGVLTLDKCKESSQWAEYEVECATIVASLLTAMEKENERQDTPLLI
ncbi:MAG: GGDEF domain-containing protein [Lachnospira sp.]|nr:GGDEF domain-containing protein [Lachnospira sp.]